MKGQVGEAVSGVLVVLAIMACVVQHLNEYFPPEVKGVEAAQNVEKR